MRSNATDNFTTLNPLQLLTAAPYAMTAGNLLGTLPACAVAQRGRAQQLIQPQLKRQYQRQRQWVDQYSRNGSLAGAVGRNRAGSIKHWLCADQYTIGDFEVARLAQCGRPC